MSFSDDEIRELVERFYTSVDRRDWETVEALMSPRLVVEVGSAPRVGWQEWRAHLEEFTLAFPDGRHVIEEVLRRRLARHLPIQIHRYPRRRVPRHTATGAKVSIAGIHIDRFQGDMLVAHRGQLDLHGLFEQLQPVTAPGRAARLGVARAALRFGCGAGQFGGMSTESMR